MSGFDFNSAFLAPDDLTEDPKFEPTELPAFVADDSLVDRNRNELGLERDQIIHILKNKVARVAFTKVDGTNRVMDVTLKEDIVPRTESSGNTRETNEEVVPCWDVNDRHWKSFRVDSLKEIVIL